MIKGNMDETKSGYSAHVGGLRGKKLDDLNYEYHCEVKEIHLNTAKMAHGGFLMFVADTGMGNAAHQVSGNKRCSLNKIKKILKKKDVSMANVDQVKSQTGFSIGGVSPVAHLEKIEILIDSSLSKYENVYAAAGHPNSIFKITYKQLVKLTKGKEEDIV